MRRVDVEIFGRIDGLPWRMMCGDLPTPAQDALVEMLADWAERYNANAAVMVRLADDATGGDDGET